MITRGHCLPFVGQHVMVRTRAGAMHHGILQSVTNDGIYMRPMTGTMRTVEGTRSTQYVQLLGDTPQVVDDIQEAWFPFFFLPFFALSAIGPWGWYW